MTIAIDFDGTVVTHAYPNIGSDIGAVSVLKELIENGHKLILFTMRSDEREDGSNPLTDAVNWFNENGIELYGVNNNPTQYTWTSSPKAYAQLYIDDAALCTPLIYPGNGERPYVDWRLVRSELLKQQIIRL